MAPMQFSAYARRGGLSEAPRMEKTKTPGVFKRGSRYIVVWQHKGRQHKSFHRTLAEAREWLEGYQGRTSRGFSSTSRRDYERALEHYAIPFFRGWRLADVESPDVRRLVRELESRRLSSASVLKNLVPLKALFATAVEDGL